MNLLRLILKTISVAFALLIGCPVSLVAADKPNVIYVMLDDAGYGDFGAFGSKHVKTPTFDKMCREGMKFTQHYSGSAVCAPTRCVLMTGTAHRPLPSPRQHRQGPAGRIVGQERSTTGFSA